MTGSSITEGFEDRKVCSWEFSGGTHVYGQSDVDELLAHARQLEARNKELVAMLWRHEWSGEDGEGNAVCPECFRAETAGVFGHIPGKHKDDCQLAKLIGSQP